MRKQQLRELIDPHVPVVVGVAHVPKRSEGQEVEEVVDEEAVVDVVEVEAVTHQRPSSREEISSALWAQ